MVIKISSLLTTAVSLFLFGLVLAVGAPAYGAPIDEALKALRGLSAKERLTRIESEARKEGSVRWASSTPQAWAEPVLQIFRKRYPNIQVEYMRQSGRVLAERIIREHRAGKYDIDIVGTSVVTFAGMKDAGVIAPYVSPEASQLRQNMKDPAGWWVAYFGNIQAIICNKNRTRAAPNDWKDFLDPKWKGEDRHGSGGIRVVCRDPPVLGQPKGAKISSRTGQAGRALE